MRCFRYAAEIMFFLVSKRRHPSREDEVPCPRSLVVVVSEGSLYKKYPLNPKSIVETEVRLADPTTQCALLF